MLEGLLALVMFNFGSPEQLYALFVENAAADPSGPGIPDLPVDEMSEEQLQQAMAYSHMAWNMARKQGADDEVLAIAKAYFDEVWTALIDADDEFRARFNSGPLAVPSTDRKPYQRYARGEISEL